MEQINIIKQLRDMASQRMSSVFEKYGNELEGNEEFGILTTEMYNKLRRHLDTNNYTPITEDNIGDFLYWGTNYQNVKNRVTTQKSLQLSDLYHFQPQTINSLTGTFEKVYKEKLARVYEDSSHSSIYSLFYDIFRITMLEYLQKSNL